ncbi:hypothetical protein KAI04_01420 [Candidatus Pacearchaeota archaeon]|nr:hypothetical protein [Candidatus Pacearchaeota archaeon]
MPTQDTSKIKEKILFTLRRRGPCLPVHIASEIETSILFASAFLSELFSEKKIKMSNMKIGSSSLYFIPGQEYLLEKFSHHLKSKEKDAFELLVNHKFLEDYKQDPAIRVALRSIKDFAIPFKEGEKIIWRYYTEKEPVPQLPKTILQKTEPIIQKSKYENKEFINEKDKEIKSLNKQEDNQKELDIFGEQKKEPIKKPIKKILVKRTSKKTSASEKKNERFFNKVKEFLIEKSISISGIEGFSKTDLILKIIDGGVEKVLIAYNKKRLLEADLLKAHKKALEYNLPYIILSLGDLPKKLENIIEAVRNLSGIDKLS